MSKPVLALISVVGAGALSLAIFPFFRDFLGWLNNVVVYSLFGAICGAVSFVATTSLPRAKGIVAGFIGIPAVVGLLFGAGRYMIIGGEMWSELDAIITGVTAGAASFPACIVGGGIAVVGRSKKRRSPTQRRHPTPRHTARVAGSQNARRKPYDKTQDIKRK